MSHFAHRMYGLVLCLGLLATAALGGCVTNAATGRSQLIVLPEYRELEIGQTGAPQFLEKAGGELPAPMVNEYVRDLGHRLAAQSERPNLPWEFFVPNTSVVNAFALPGGKVFVTRGLLEKLDNEAQLAGVLGHEVGHVTAKHINDKLVQAMGVQLVGFGIGVAGDISDEEWLRYLGLGTQVGGGLYLLSFGRNQENEADELGLRYMTSLGYNPLGQVQVMQVLKQAGGSGQTLEFLSTHPAPQTRIRHLGNYIATHYPDYNEPGRYRFARDQFHNMVLTQLHKLPPPPE